MPARRVCGLPAGALAVSPASVVMAGYVVEVYVSRHRATGLDDMSARARRAAEDLARAGTPVVYVRSVFLPEDETCFHFFEAPSREAIQKTCSHLGLTFERIAVAKSFGLSPQEGVVDDFGRSCTKTDPARGARAPACRLRRLLRFRRAAR